jgi:hypothetical protein
MRMKIALAGVALVVITVILVACNSRGSVTATPAGAAVAVTASAACTPTPAVPHPTYTIGPNQQATPGIAITAVVLYQATYPGSGIAITQTLDLAPQIPTDDKWRYIVRHSDCTYEYVLVPSNRTSTFGRDLPPGDAVYSGVPPASALGAGARVPLPKTPTGSQTPALPPSTTAHPPSPPPPPPPSLQTAVVHTLETQTSGSHPTPVTGTPVTTTPSR